MENERTKPKDFGRTSFAAPFIEVDHPNQAYLGDPHVDNLMLIVYGLATELWAERERSRIMQGLMERGEKVTEEAIQAYVPSDEERANWSAELDAMNKRLFSVLGRDTSNTRAFDEPRFPAQRF